MMRKAKSNDWVRASVAWPLKKLVRAYQIFLSPLLPPRCRFEPSCSQYALEALDTHGALKGLWLTARRLARCHPLTWLGGSSGYDPVPHACAGDQPHHHDTPSTIPNKPA